MGVLVDNVLGYALMLDRPVGQWSVSSEISADLRRPVPADGSVLLAEARPFHCGSSGGLSSGWVLESRAQLIVLCRQHVRRVAGVPAAEKHPGKDAPGLAPPVRANLPDLLGAWAETTEGLPFPVIAAVHGAAVGGGMALALAADIRLVAPTAKFSAAFVKVGLSVGELGTSYNVRRLVGPGRAAEIGYTGRFVGAEEAVRIGMANRMGRQSTCWTRLWQWPG